ncbi:hypothetical protein [Pseudomonas frederiksbergensis]|uniref:hypothetical protein n=1 Tax=Pseudomonas frederiksbergensis TaxID=104087 RepID=UPI0019536338|nr:hypothetical protein [Pseudomonas frederiksbergensis]
MMGALQTTEIHYAQTQKKGAITAPFFIIQIERTTINPLEANDLLFQTRTLSTKHTHVSAWAG